MPVLRGISLLMLVAAYGCCHGLSSEQNAIRVGTYNVRMSLGDKGTPNAWPDRRRALVELVRNLDLDVFGMQEVTPEQATYFKNHLKDWAFVGDHREADKVSGEASPVFYRKSRFEALKLQARERSQSDAIGSRIDFIYVSPTVRVLDYRTVSDSRPGLSLYPSDHFPVVANIVLP